MYTCITKINGRWYAYAVDHAKRQVQSIGKDSNGAKRQGGYAYIAHWDTVGIRYVATSSPSRAAAYQKAKRHGDYFGEVYV